MNSLVSDAHKAGERVGLKSDKIVINGGKPLKGRIELRGAKNLATKAMVAALLADSPSTLKDVPNISDVGVVTGMLEAYGVSVTETEPGVLVLDPTNVEKAHFAQIDSSLERFSAVDDDLVGLEADSLTGLVGIANKRIHGSTFIE